MIFQSHFGSPGFEDTLKSIAPADKSNVSSLEKTASLDKSTFTRFCGHPKTRRLPTNPVFRLKTPPLCTNPLSRLFAASRKQQAFSQIRATRHFRSHLDARGPVRKHCTCRQIHNFCTLVDFSLKIMWKHNTSSQIRPSRSLFARFQGSETSHLTTQIRF